MYSKVAIFSSSNFRDMPTFLAFVGKLRHDDGWQIFSSSRDVKSKPAARSSEIHVNQFSFMIGRTGACNRLITSLYDRGMTESKVRLIVMSFEQMSVTCYLFAQPGSIVFVESFAFSAKSS